MKSTTQDPMRCVLDGEWMTYWPMRTDAGRGFRRTVCNLMKSQAQHETRDHGGGPSYLIGEKSGE